MKKRMLCFAVVLGSITVFADTYVYRTPGVVEGVVNSVGTAVSGTVTLGTNVLFGSTTVVRSAPAAAVVPTAGTTVVTTSPAAVAPVCVVPAQTVYAAPVYVTPGYVMPVYPRYYHPWRGCHPAYSPWRYHHPFYSYRPPCWCY